MHALQRSQPGWSVGSLCVRLLFVVSAITQDLMMRCWCVCTVARNRLFNTLRVFTHDQPRRLNGLRFSTFYGTSNVVRIMEITETSKLCQATNDLLVLQRRHRDSWCSKKSTASSSLILTKVSRVNMKHRGTKSRTTRHDQRYPTPASPRV